MSYFDAGDIRLALNTAATSDPVSAAEAKTHLRIDDNAHDTWITNAITAATEWTQKYCRRQWVNATWDQYAKQFPTGNGPLIMRLSPLSSVSAVAYTDSNGDSQTLTVTTDYTVDTYAVPGRIWPAYGEVWPDVRDIPNAVKVTAVIGYGATSASVPEAPRQAILMLVGHWFEHRESVVIGSASREVEFATKSLLSPYRMREIL